MKRLFLSLIFMACGVSFAHATNCVAVQVVSAAPHVVQSNVALTPVVVQPFVSTLSFQPVAVHPFSNQVILTNAVFTPLVNQQVVVQRVRRGIFRPRVTIQRAVVRTRALCR